jgi:hypothetical protein
VSTCHDDFTSILIRRKVLSEAQLQGARLLQRQTNGRLPDVLVEFGYLTNEQVSSALAEMRNQSVARLQPRHPIDLTDVVIPREILDLVPESVARENLLIPFAVLDGILHVVMLDPNDQEVLSKLIFVLNRDIQPLSAPRHQIIDCINRHYGPVKPEAADALLCEFTDTAIDFSETASLDAELRSLREEAIDLGSSEFDLALEDDGSQAMETEVRQSRRTQLAMDDAAREAADWGGGPAPMAAAVPARIRGRAMCYAAPAPLVERQATIRYYHRMSPERMFPLLAVISRKEILKVIKKHVAQKQSEKFHVALDSDVEIEPILPGCECFPRKETVRITSADATARFWVVPHVLGVVMHARVMVRQDGAVLAEVPLEICVSKQTLTLFAGAMNFCVPFVSMLLKQSHLSLSSAEGHAGVLAALVGWALLVLSPEVMAGLLLVATVGLYLWLRPRQRDVFWDIQPVGASATSPQSH